MSKPRRPELPTCKTCRAERGRHYYGCTDIPPLKPRPLDEPEGQEAPEKERAATVPSRSHF